MTATTILSDNGVSSGSAGIKTTGGNDGTLALQTTTSGGTATTALTIDTSQNTTLAGYLNAPNTFGFKNRIINGAMMIDQRNAGASVTPANNNYTVDRWVYNSSQASKVTIQQTTGDGFGNSLKVTSSSSYSVLSTDYFLLQQPIEGFNFADMQWGTANASAVTLSFKVKSSLTGTFGGVLTNNGLDRSYPFSYTISAANTWEQKSVTIVGDTSGTWVGATNGIGCRVYFNLGTGSTYSGTAGSWSGSTYLAPTGAVSVVGTSGATWQVTNVQLEKGSTATSFDYRPYGTELALCQRYYWKTFNQATAPVQGSGSAAGALLASTSATSTFGASTVFPVVMRVAPTVTTYNPQSGVLNANWRDTNNAADRTVGSATSQDSGVSVTGLAGIVNGLNFIHLTASAEL